MKKILYICPSSGMGGAETFLIQTQTCVNKSEFENHYLLFRSGPLVDKLKSLGAHVHLLNTPPRLSKLSDRRLVLKKIKDLINGYNISLVHSTTAYAALFSAGTCKSMQVPHVWFQHGQTPGWMDRAAAVLYHDGLIVNSHHTGKIQRKLENPVRFLIPRKNPIEKILLGTPIVEWSSQDVEQEKTKWASAGHFSPDLPLIGMLCRIEKRKGIPIFLEAVAELQADPTVTDFQAIIWGETFKEKDSFHELTEQVKQKNLPIYFAGPTINASLSLATCDIFVNASIQPEPFGLSVVEAMMVGAVPIVPSEGGPAEVISNGKNGLVFKARQATSLAKQIRTLLKDATLLRTLSDTAKQVARQKYNAKRVISHLESFHLKIIG